MITTKEQALRQIQSKMLPKLTDYDDFNEALEGIFDPINDMSDRTFVHLNKSLAECAKETEAFKYNKDLDDVDIHYSGVYGALERIENLHLSNIYGDKVYMRPDIIEENVNFVRIEKVLADLLYRVNGSSDLSTPVTLDLFDKLGADLHKELND